MSPEQGDDRQVLLKKVTNSLRKAERVTVGLSKANTRVVFASVFGSAACTLVAGITAAHGPVVGEGPDGWRLACTISAVLAFEATVAIGLGHQLRISDRLSTAHQCVGRLRSLDVVIMTPGTSLEDAINEYVEIVQTFPECID